MEGVHFGGDLILWSNATTRHSFVGYPETLGGKQAGRLD